MSTRQKALDALADIEHQASGGLEIDSALFRTVRAALSAAPAPQPAGGEPRPAAQQEPLTVDYSGCDICARETATIAGFRLMVDPSLPPDVLVFRQGEREVGRIINAGITATKGER